MSEGRTQRRLVAIVATDVDGYAHRLLSWRMQHTDKTLSHIRVRREGMEVRA